MRRVVILCAVTLAASAGVATIAGGQSGGAPESGTFTYELVTKFSAKASPTSNPGNNPALPRDRGRQNAGDINAQFGRIVLDGKAAGTEHTVLTWTRTGKGRRGRNETLLLDSVADFGNGDQLVLQGLQGRNLHPRTPVVVVGGAGRFAGADGTALIEEVGFNERTRTLREKVTVTFTP